jgi:uncharacterized protein (TIGR02453 family)
MGMIYFSEHFFSFFKELEKNNNKDWFDIHRKEYEENIKKPFEIFIKDLLEKLLEFDNELNTDYKKSIFRINRDIRFSKDKSPYKLNRSAAFSKIAKKDIEHPGYYIDINSKRCMIAGGAWSPSTEHLKKIRQEIYYNLDEFNQILSDKEFVKQLGTVHGEKAVRLQEPFVDYAQESEWIKNKQFYFIAEFDPKKCLEPNFIEFLISKFKAGYALNQFLRRAMHD